MVPVGGVAECVAIKPGVIEIVQTVEILRCELVVSELIVSELITAKLIVGGKRVATRVCEIVTGNPSSITGHRVIVTEIMGSELMTAAAHGVTGKSMCVHGVSRKAVSAQCMATPPMTHVGHATMGSKPVKPAAMPATAPTVKPSKPTASAMPATTPAAPTVKTGKTTAAAAKSTASTAPAMPAAATPTAMPAATTTPTTMPGDCRDVGRDAKRAHRNACRQNAYRSFVHGTLLTRSSEAIGAAARATTARTSPHLTFITTVSAARF
jgi:hypothetical protein